MTIIMVIMKRPLKKTRARIKTTTILLFALTLTLT
jgi:hypothetical protein